MVNDGTQPGKNRPEISTQAEGGLLTIDWARNLRFGKDKEGGLPGSREAEIFAAYRQSPQYEQYYQEYVHLLQNHRFSVPKDEFTHIVQNLCNAIVRDIGFAYLSREFPKILSSEDTARFYAEKIYPGAQVVQGYFGRGHIEIEGREGRKRRPPVPDGIIVGGSGSDRKILLSVNYGSWDMPSLINKCAVDERNLLLSVQREVPDAIDIASRVMIVTPQGVKYKPDLFYFVWVREIPGITRNGDDGKGGVYGFVMREIVGRWKEESRVSSGQVITASDVITVAEPDISQTVVPSIETDEGESKTTDFAVEVGGEQETEEDESFSAESEDEKNLDYEEDEDVTGYQRRTRHSRADRPSRKQRRRDRE